MACLCMPEETGYHLTTFIFASVNFRCSAPRHVSIYKSEPQLFCFYKWGHFLLCTSRRDLPYDVFSLWPVRTSSRHGLPISAEHSVGQVSLLIDYVKWEPWYLYLTGAKRPAFVYQETRCVFVGGRVFVQDSCYQPIPGPFWYPWMCLIIPSMHFGVS